MARILSAQERVALAVDAQLRTISVENGYNTNVCFVERIAGVPLHREKLPAIYHWFGDGTYNTGNNANAQIEARVPLGISMGVPCERQTAQSELEFIRSDIYKALFVGDRTQIGVSVEDGARNLLVDIEYLGFVPSKVEESGPAVAAGLMVYAMRWPQQLSDPAKFTPADVAVEEDS